MGYKAAKRTSLVLSWQLRLLSALQLLAGGGYVAFACVLQFPPGDVMTAGLWVIGALAILCALTGFVAGCQVRCCLPVYMTLAVLATMAQAGLVLYLFIAPDKAVKKLSEYQEVNGNIKENLDEIVNIGRWVLLGLLGAQVVAILVALVMKKCTRSARYLQFEEQDDYERRREEADSQLGKLKSKVLAAEAQQAEQKRVIHLTAVSGSAAAQQQGQQAQRSALFADTEEDTKLEEAEAGGMIGSSRTRSEPLAMVAPSASQPPVSAWPAQPATQPRSFRATWSKAKQ